MAPKGGRGGGGGSKGGGFGGISSEVKIPIKYVLGRRDFVTNIAGAALNALWGISILVLLIMACIVAARFKSNLGKSPQKRRWFSFFIFAMVLFLLNFILSLTSDVLLLLDTSVPASYLLVPTLCRLFYSLGEIILIGIFAIMIVKMATAKVAGKALGWKIMGFLIVGVLFIIMVVFTAMGLTVAGMGIKAAKESSGDIFSDSASDLTHKETKIVSAFVILEFAAVLALLISTWIVRSKINPVHGDLPDVGAMKTVGTILGAIAIPPFLIYLLVQVALYGHYTIYNSILWDKYHPDATAYGTDEYYNYIDNFREASPFINVGFDILSLGEVLACIGLIIVGWKLSSRDLAGNPRVIYPRRQRCTSAVDVCATTTATNEAATATICAAVPTSASGICAA